MTKVGIASAIGRDPYQLGRDNAITALNAGGITSPDLLLAFCHGLLDHTEYYRGLREIVGNVVPIIGGSCIGVITQDLLDYQNTPAAAAVIQSDTIRFCIASASEVNRDERETGSEMCRQLEFNSDDQALLLFYDSIKIPLGPDHPPVLNSSAPLLKGVVDCLAKQLPIFGAGVIGDYGFGPTSQFIGHGTASNQVVGCLVSGNCRLYHSVMHGCIPMDGVYHTITRMKGDTIYEIDGRPVVPFINELFGNDLWQQDRPVVSNLTIGVNRGDRFGVPDEQNYVNRLITGVTPDGSGIGMFEADLAEGIEIQFMIRDNRMILESVRRNVPAILAAIRQDGQHPVLALYIDCGGRSAQYSITEEDEAESVRMGMKAAGIPLLGFYSGVEIAPMKGSSRGLDWTGVLVIITENN